MFITAQVIEKDKNPDVRELLEVVKAEPHLAQVMVSISHGGAAAPVPEATDWSSRLAESAGDWRGQEDAVQKREREKGMDLGM